MSLVPDFEAARRSYAKRLLDGEITGVEYDRRIWALRRAEDRARAKARLELRRQLRQSLKVTP